MLRTTLLGTACAVGLLAAPVAAHATTVSVDGAKVKVVGTEGADRFEISVHEGRVLVNGSPLEAGPGCTGDEWKIEVKCPLPADGIDVSTLGGDDDVRGMLFDERAGFLTIHFGAGDDRLETYGGDVAFGEDGNDVLKSISKEGRNTFDGGAGNDELAGAGDADVLRGGDGDDKLDGDAAARAADVLDGGAGRDVVDDWAHEDPYDKTPATVTLDGAADDGFPGEGDNVTNVESIRSSNGIVFRGTDAAEQVIAGEVGGKGSQEGRGGDDELQGSDDDETIDGGAGNDDIRAGYGNDTITGGAGRDKIVADREGRCNELHCDLSPGSAADTIDAVDGERDVIACGPGIDTVKADAADEVGADCEDVVRASGGATPPGAGGAPVLAPSGAKTLRTLRAGKLRVRVSGLQPGAAVKLTASSRGRVVASGSGRAGTTGTAAVKLRLTKAGRKALRRARTVSLTISGAGGRLALRLR